MFDMKAYPKHFALVVAVAAFFGSGVLLANDTTNWAWTAILGVILAYLTSSDIADLTLPDAATGCLAMLGLIFLASSAPHSLIGHIMGAVVAGGILWAIAAGYFRLRGRDGLGLGDVKLFAAGALWVGPWLLPQVLLIASGAGLIFAMARGGFMPIKKQDPIPFGPFICLALWLTWHMGEHLPDFAALR